MVENVKIQKDTKKEYVPPQNISIINIFLNSFQSFLKIYIFLSEKSRLFFI